MATRDYYDALGIGRTASLAEIKVAHRKLAMKYHPDRNPGDAMSEEKFKEIEEAYSELSDPKKRKEYDEGQASSMTDKPWQFCEQLWQSVIDNITSMSKGGK